MRHSLMRPSRRGRAGSGDRIGVATRLDRGVVAFGTVWLGGDTAPFRGVVVVDGRGVVDYAGPFGAFPVPTQVPVIGGPDAWIGPGIVDAHVHLAFGDVNDCLRVGLVGVRDLGAPLAQAQQWRSGHRPPVAGRPVVAVAGPIITAPGGYPSQSWGRDGFAAFADSIGPARQLVQRLAADGVDVIKVALEPGDGRGPLISASVLSAIVETAHDAGLAVVAHALQADMVALAVRSGVDELAHTPTELVVR